MNNKSFIGMGHNPNPNVPDLPEGFAMALLQESDARTNYENLSNTQKVNLIHYIQSNNQTGYEAKNKIDNVIKNLKSNNIEFYNIF